MELENLKLLLFVQGMALEKLNLLLFCAGIGAGEVKVIIVLCREWHWRS